MQASKKALSIAPNIYDWSTIEDTYGTVKNALPEFEVLFSVKANPSLAICHFLAQLGAGAEVTFGGCGDLPKLNSACHEDTRSSIQSVLDPDVNINAGLVIEFLRHLIRQSDGPVVLVWDRLLAHRAKKGQAFIRNTPNLHVYLLSPHAPELNPVANVWGYLKMNPLSNRPLFDVDSLAWVAKNHRRSIQRKLSRLRSSVKHSFLSFCLR